MDDKELEIDVRRWLDSVVNRGTYDENVLRALKNLYYCGRRSVQDEIKNALNIDSE